MLKLKGLLIMEL